MKSIGYYIEKCARHGANLRDRKCISWADKCLNLDPECRPVKWNRGISLLRLGRFREAWRDWESGIGTGAREHRNWPNRWGGVSDVSQKTVYIICEQGLGDMIQFLQFLAPMRAHFKPHRVILEVQPALYSLLKNYEHADEVVEKPTHRFEPHREHDVWCSILSLPAFLDWSP